MSLPPTLSVPFAAPADGGGLLHTLVMASPLAIYFLDLEERVQLWNPAAERIFGWRADEVLGRVNPTVPPDKWEEAQALMEVILRGEVVTERELWRARRNGTLIEVGLSAARICDATGAPQGIMAITADITDRRRLEVERTELLRRERHARAEAEAAARRARLLAEGSALLDASLDDHTTLRNLARFVVPEMADFCLIDELEDGIVSRVAAVHRNPRREGWLEAGARHPLSSRPECHPIVRVLREQGPVLVEEVTDELLDTLASAFDHEQMLRLRPCSVMVIPLTARGRTLGAMTLACAESGRLFRPADLELAEEFARRAALAIDTTRLYHQARQAVRARERLLAVVSHDLRNSLATVLLNASAVLETRYMLPEGSPAREPLEWIVRSAEQMNRMIHDLLDASTIEAGKLAIEPRSQTVEPLVREALEMCRPLALERGIRCSAAVAPGLPRVRVDRERIQQVLGNLLGNALKFSPPAGEIVLGAEHGDGGEGEEVRLFVSDQGPGVAEEHLDSIFDHFWQGRRGKGMGAGLGLAIARGIVEAHGGAIWVSRNPEAGCTFHFTVPAAAGPAEAVIE